MLTTSTLSYCTPSSTYPGYGGRFDHYHDCSQSVNQVYTEDINMTDPTSIWDCCVHGLDLSSFPSTGTYFLSMLLKKFLRT